MSWCLFIIRQPESSNGLRKPAQQYPGSQSASYWARFSPSLPGVPAQKPSFIVGSILGGINLWNQLSAACVQIRVTLPAAICCRCLRPALGRLSCGCHHLSFSFILLSLVSHLCLPWRSAGVSFEYSRSAANLIHSWGSSNLIFWHFSLQADWVYFSTSLLDIYHLWTHPIYWFDIWFYQINILNTSL